MTAKNGFNIIKYKDIDIPISKLLNNLAKKKVFQ